MRSAGRLSVLLLLVSGVLPREAMSLHAPQKHPPNLPHAQPPQENRNHVFLVQRCASWPNTTIDGQNGDLSAYINVSLPWETPVNGCTQQGLEQIKAVGKHVMQTHLKEAQEIHIEFVTDTAQRHVATALALAEGLVSGLVDRNDDAKISGLDTVHHLPHLFHPARDTLEDQLLSGETVHKGPLCTIDTQADKPFVMSNLDATPRPETSLNDTINLLETLVGVGTAGSLHNLPLSSESGCLDETGLELTGAPQVLATMGKVLLQAKVMSQTSNNHALNNNPLVSAPLHNVVPLISWYFWRTRLLHQNTLSAASRGSVLSHFILQRLQQPPPPLSLQETLSYKPQKPQQPTRHSVTFLVGGDDTTLTAVATALNLQWALPQPYQQPNNWTVGIPGSALHVSHSTTHNEKKRYLDISMLIPSLLSEETDNGSMALQVSSVPVTLVSSGNLTSSKVVNNQTTTRVESQNEKGNVVWLLRTMLENSLATTYPSAMACYKAAQQRFVASTTSQSQGGQPPSTNSNSPKLGSLIPHKPPQGWKLPPHKRPGQNVGPLPSLETDTTWQSSSSSSHHHHDNSSAASSPMVTFFLVVVFFFAIASRVARLSAERERQRLPPSARYRHYRDAQQERGDEDGRGVHAPVPSSEVEMGVV